LSVEFDKALLETSKQVQEYIMSHGPHLISNKDLAESVIHYTRLGGKKLRPFVVLACCGAVGGNSVRAMPLAAAVEMYHTWTLVHDDIIDQDSRRRSGETVHARWTRMGRTLHRFTPDLASHYGLTVGILAGDLQKGWSVAGLLPQLHHEQNVKPALVLKLVEELDYTTLQILVDGEILDVFYSRKSLRSITDSEVLDMLWKKTGALYQFCGKGGAMVGLNSTNEEKRAVQNLAAFTGLCGIAFQIQDDILGLVGNESHLGKPVGSDVRQGKRTLAVLEAFRHANSEQRKEFQSILGNPAVSDKQIRGLTKLIRDLGGVEYAQNIARAYIEGGKVNGKQMSGAMHRLKGLKETKYADLLRSWAEFLINRSF
jgi:geranylgeranyl diphosphate synthase, type I